MKNLFLLVFMATFFVACGTPEGQEVESGEALPEAKAVATQAATAYTVDPSASSVTWEGGKATGTHTGEIPVSDGRMMVSEGNIVDGQFTMNINGLTNTDMPAEDGGDKLVGHLKSADFFDVENYPFAKFELRQVQAVEGTDGVTHELTGNLTLKGETRSVTIPANVMMDGNKLMATTPKFTIDRKEWGMNYGSASLAGVAQDKVIYDEVGLQIKLTATKS